MGFREQMAAAIKETNRRIVSVRDGVADGVFTSVVEGSPLTGAPGQPVRSGRLHDSWTKELSGTDKAVISTEHPAAPAVEDDWDGVAYHNHGPHSVSQTVAGAQRIVDDVVARIVGGEA